MFRKFTAFLLILLLWFSHSAPPSAQAQAYPSSEILRLVNELRASYNLPGYQYNNTLAAAAQNHANWMASTAVYSHTETDGSTPQTRANAVGYVGYVSENIVGGTSLSPQQGVTWWINSPVHFNTLISNRYTEIGLGYAVGNGQNFYVLVVGNPSNSPAPPPRSDIAEKENTAFIVAPIEVNAPREDGSIVHQVGQGQTVWAIAARYEVTVDEILWLNSLPPSPILQPGQELIIRLGEGQSPPPTPTPPSTHLVEKGETAWTIAARYKIALSDFLWLNSLSGDPVLQPGQEVIVRLAEGQAPPPTSTPQMSHIVQSGDTPLGIALTYGLTLEQLQAYNNLAPNAFLQIGQELWIRPTELPTFTPTPEMTATPTLTPTAVASPQRMAGITVVATLATSATPTPSPQPAPTPIPSPRNVGRTVAVGSLVAAIGLTLLAATAVLILRRG